VRTVPKALGTGEKVLAPSEQEARDKLRLDVPG
jgi:hypothetical protein